ncbi:hypothetical protein [Lutibacter sp. B1]|uniref:hypothetical protein n=1 Tax=Lutibacter sp. B1 TaxID=2725996 RepID=UPI0014565DE9|nr:hypothetical protein [Lutibacter sp. B1]NLP59192.1 hypothetical protein [Lutibacter sp. B1]
MKKYTLITIFLINTYLSFGQILPGTLDVSGFPNISQTINDLVSEAGLDDTSVGFESNFDTNLITFTLDPTILMGITAASTEQNCDANVFRYSVYMYTSYVPDGFIIEAKTTFDSGFGLPAVSTYDTLPIQPLGPRGLTPENGGNYITIPRDGASAIKVFEFVGCREDIPIQFRIKPSVKVVGGNPVNFDVYYTVVGSLN